MKKILFVAGREAEYSRSRIVYKALEEQGFEVVGCFPPDKSFKHYPKLIYRAVRLAKSCDLVLVGFYGQIILPIIKLLTGRAIIFDMYIATYHTMVQDRGKAKEGSLKAWFYKLSDIVSCKCSRFIVLESQDHIIECARLFHEQENKFRRIFLAVDDQVIFPRNIARMTEQFLVHFHGEYAPFHGIKYILQAAHLLRNENIHFQIIGKGITFQEDQELARRLELNNVTFIDPVPYETLADYMARADVCLGIFGDNPRTLRVVTNKVVEAIAMAKPLITARNNPVQELLTHEKSVYFVERANPGALADAVLKLKNDENLRNAIAKGGHEVFINHCTLSVLGKEFSKLFKEMNCNANG
ncbi:MAG: glycosyltransferase [Calditrichaeota bacterium]|nr:MAG: glycosyltransferase [Calditrichota bacterium]